MIPNNNQVTIPGNYAYSTMSQNSNPQLANGYAINGGIASTQNVQGFASGAMGVGGGKFDDAVDVTYSTKPDNQGQAVNLNAGYATSSFNYNLVGQDAGLGAVQYEQNINAAVAQDAGNVMATNSSVMGFGQGGDAAIDVTYSTKPDNQGVGLVNTGITGLTTTVAQTTYPTMIENTMTTTTTENTAGSVMGFGQGGDDAIDVTYSTKPDNQGVVVNQGITELTNTYNTASVNVNTNIDINNMQELQMYKQTTLLPDKVQHIVQKEYQPIIKTVIKPIIQREYQPIIEKEIRPIVQQEYQPIIEREIQPILIIG